ncbi:TPM domain-containing protein [Methylocapsa acidiphila]|uniref:TPM domain-containing protein n=1 Tax=Methylocapsa acidiphila TaxID=133552 RepID=UPI000424F905|nr:TPM domain-containing protein [Methylocapsa acidiphila]
MILSIEDQRRVGGAIQTAEEKTSGEIVCVLARSSSDYLAYATAWSALAALIAPWALVAFTQFSVERILVAQALLFTALFVVASASRLRHFLVPRRVRRAQAHRAAMEQFMIRGMARKANRAGVLIFVSLAERYVRIVADDGIADKVDPSVWQEAVDALLDRASEGRIGDGFMIAVEKCGAVLAAHFPPGERRDDLPDRLFVI